MQDLTLILNAAEARIQVLILQDDLLIYDYDCAAEKNGTELLAPIIDNAFFSHKLSRQKLSKIACVNGPGSFTGLRLVLGTCHGLVRGLKEQKITQAPINYMQALAQNLDFSEQLKYIRVITHAKRDLVHLQDFVQTIQKSVVAVSDISLLPPSEAALLSTFNDYDFCLLGSGHTKNYSEITGILSQTPNRPFTQLDSSFDNPSPMSLTTLALEANYTTKDLEALYIRPCDALDNLEQIATKLGQNPKESLNKLNQILNSKAVIF